MASKTKKQKLIEALAEVESMPELLETVKGYKKEGKIDKEIEFAIHRATVKIVGA